MNLGSVIVVLCGLCGVRGALNNGMFQLPQVECQSQRIKVSLQTKDSFNGRIYLKGNSKREECVTDFSKFRPANDTDFQVAIDYNLCNTERIRTLSPNGVTYANTMVVQFHKRFITKGDKAYHIRCFYSELEKTVQSNFDVSQLPTGSLQFDMQMPTCTYTVRRGTVNGPMVRSAQVGDEVYHQWECTGNTAAYGMLVHSCIVEDTLGETEAILTKEGCTLENDLLPQLEYNDDLSMAYAKAQVFKYPDNSFIHFKCQIRVCTKLDDQCQSIAPPQCNRGPKRRARSIDVLESTNLTLLTAGHNGKHTTASKSSDIDVLTEEILVLEENEPNKYKSYNSLDKNLMDVERSQSIVQSGLSNDSGRDDDKTPRTDLRNLPQAQICASRFLIVCILAGFFLFFASALICIVYLMVRNRAKNLDTLSSSSHSMYRS